jgi:hypothetical protein
VSAHDTHCCRRHGCKYGSGVCPVVLGEVIALSDCEWCSYERNEESKALDVFAEWFKDQPIDLKREHIDGTEFLSIHELIEEFLGRDRG